MGCMKCGRDTIAEQVFCPDCLQEMEKYPVRPGTVVQLPNRSIQSAAKKTVKKRTVPLEDQVKILKKRVRNLMLALILAIALAAALSIPAVEHLMENHFAIGQNYNTVTTPTTEAS